MITQTLTAPRQRTVEALEAVADQYALSADLDALHRAGDDWRDQALAIACVTARGRALPGPSRKRPYDGTAE